MSLLLAGCFMRGSQTYVNTVIALLCFILIPCLPIVPQSPNPRKRGGGTVETGSQSVLHSLVHDIVNPLHAIAQEDDDKEKRQARRHFHIHLGGAFGRRESNALGTTVALHGGLHDSTVLLATDCTVLVVGTLETVTGVPNFGIKDIGEAWPVMWPSLKPFLGDRSTITTVILGKGDNVGDDVIPRKRTYRVGHHLAHATYAFFDSPFRTALVLSVDGGGDDQAFTVFNASRQSGEVALMAAPCPYLGMAWTRFTQHPNLTDLPSRLTKSRGGGWARPSVGLMDYSMLGRVRKEWVEVMTQVVRLCPYHGPKAKEATARLYSQVSLTSQEDHRDYAATAQDVLQTAVFEEVDHFKAFIDQVDGIAFAGGVALNTLLNTELAKRYRKPIHVPACPGDDGLSVGMLYKQGCTNPEPLLYNGFNLKDKDKVLDFVLECGGRHFPRGTSVKSMAGLVAKGSVVAVLRGRQGTGSVVGHRTVFASPTAESKRKMFSLVNAQWYSQVRVLITFEAAALYFADPQRSPYMSFTMQLKPEHRERFKEVANAGHRLLVQTVTKASEPWLYDVLQALDGQTGLPMMMAVGFMHKEVAINSIRDGLRQLHAQPLLQGLFIEDFLFQKDSPCSLD